MAGVNYQRGNDDFAASLAALQGSAQLQLNGWKELNAGFSELNRTLQANKMREQTERHFRGKQSLDFFNTVAMERGVRGALEFLGPAGSHFLFTTGMGMSDDLATRVTKVAGSSYSSQDLLQEALKNVIESGDYRSFIGAIQEQEQIIQERTAVESTARTLAPATPSEPPASITDLHRESTVDQRQAIVEQIQRTESGVEPVREFTKFVIRELPEKDQAFIIEKGEILFNRESTSEEQAEALEAIERRDGGNDLLSRFLSQKRLPRPTQPDTSDRLAAERQAVSDAAGGMTGTVQFPTRAASPTEAQRQGPVVEPTGPNGTWTTEDAWNLMKSISGVTIGQTPNSEYSRLFYDESTKSYNSEASADSLRVFNQLRQALQEGVPIQSEADLKRYMDGKGLDSLGRPKQVSEVERDSSTAKMREEILQRLSSAVPNETNEKMLRIGELIQNPDTPVREVEAALSSKTTLRERARVAIGTVVERLNSLNLREGIESLGLTLPQFRNRAKIFERDMEEISTYWREQREGKSVLTPEGSKQLVELMTSDSPLGRGLYGMQFGADVLRTNEGARQFDITLGLEQMAQEARAAAQMALAEQDWYVQSLGRLEGLLIRTLEGVEWDPMKFGALIEKEPLTRELLTLYVASVANAAGLEVKMEEIQTAGGFLGMFRKFTEMPIFDLSGVRAMAGTNASADANQAISERLQQFMTQFNAANSGN